MARLFRSWPFWLSVATLALTLFTGAVVALLFLHISEQSKGSVTNPTVDTVSVSAPLPDSATAAQVITDSVVKEMALAVDRVMSEADTIIELEPMYAKPLLFPRSVDSTTSLMLRKLTKEERDSAWILIDAAGDSLRRALEILKEK